jgi:tRNA(Ile)-lysidine synthase
VCRERKVPLTVVKVDVQPGNSLERAAREARHAVLAAQSCDFVALAHNQDDQVETVLLHLFRGTGVRGLAGMRVVSEFPVAAAGRRAPRLLRPLLDVPRSAIIAYAQHRDLAWVEDPSNSDARFLRNYLRSEVLPRVASRIPAYREAVARAARHAAEAALSLDELAARDAGWPADGASAARSLAVDTLRRLPGARAKNVLRHFLQQHGVEIPSSERLAEALRQLVDAPPDAQVCVDTGAGKMLRRHRGNIVVTARQERAARPSRTAQASAAWSGERDWALPELGGVLRMQAAKGTGISAAKLRAGRVTLTRRRGGERLRLDERRPRRTVKNLLQELGVPAWERGERPFLYCGEALVWVEGLGVDAAYRAQPGEDSIRPVWMPGRRR